MLPILTEIPLATCFYAGFFLGFFFHPEDRGDMFLQNVVDFQGITRRYIRYPNHRCENLNV
jgi:hypothetical protein